MSQNRSGRGSHEGDHVFDTAAGILAELRRYSTDAAVRELITAGERYRISVSTIASALVTLAGRGVAGRRPGTAAQLAAEMEWGENYWPPSSTAGNKS